MKKKIYDIIIAVAIISIILLTVIGAVSKILKKEENIYSDGLEKIDANTIYLTNSKVKVNFSDVILTEHNETRKLIVSEQEGSVSVDLEKSLIEHMDYDFMKKTQAVSYNGKGYFVVDLSQLTTDDIIEDKENKTVTILINHTYLETIDIDPDKVIIDEVKESLLARGKMKITVEEYNEVEKQLRDKMEEKLNTPKNAQEADDIALKMVKEVYQNVVWAVDSRYNVIVEFK